MAPVEVRVREDRTDAPADHCPGDDPHHHEQEVVGAHGGTPGNARRQTQRDEDGRGQRNRLPADRDVAKAQHRIEVERDDGDRHGRECSRQACRLADTRAVLSGLNRGLQRGRKCVQPLGPVLGFGIELVGGIRGDWGVCHDRSLGTGPGGLGPARGPPKTGVHMRMIARCPGAALHVQLLGRVEVSADDGTPVRLSGRHAQALFALLVLSRRPRSRDALATDLWPDSDGTSSAALRQALWLVRNAFNGAGLDPDAVLEVESETIGLQPDARIELDTDHFEECVLNPDCATETAVELYRGDLAEGLGHDCFAAERERLSDLFEDALSDVGEQRLRRGDLAGARRAAEELLARDPLREEAHALLISIHGLIGSRSQVVRQYRRLRAVLDRELGVEPLPESEATYRLALVHTLERSRARAAALGQVSKPTLVAVNA